MIKLLGGKKGRTIDDITKPLVNMVNGLYSHANEAAKTVQDAETKILAEQTRASNAQAESARAEALAKKIEALLA